MAHRRSGLQHPASNFKRQASNLEHCNTLLATPSGQLCYDLRAMNPRRLMLYLMLNAAVSATATLTVLWLWDRARPPVNPPTAPTRAAQAATSGGAAAAPPPSGGGGPPPPAPPPPPTPRS